ncbi:MAG: flagellar hook assembly protein FlgD [Bacillota bacterium]
MDTSKAVEASRYGLPQKGTRVPKKVLNKDDFLSLLVAQLKNQDPLEPQSNEEFLSTMAQFNSLETLTSLDRSIHYSQAIAMMNRPVTVQELNKDPVAGMVEKVGVVDGKVMVYIGGNKYSISDVKEIHLQDTGNPSVSGSDIVQAALMIGRQVLLDSGEQVGGTVEKVGVVDGRLKVYVNGKPYDISTIIEVGNPDHDSGSAGYSSDSGQIGPPAPGVTEGES